ncbi:MAG: addiction module toxin, HicA family [bacterium]|nr:addiction module toxin, HicA family [bacterium]
MSDLTTVNYIDVVRVLINHGFLMVGRENGHIRLQRETADGQTRLIIPENETLKAETMGQIIRYSGLSVNDYEGILDY